ncbi:MAG TPA: hypothetical protein VNI84_10590 [Pyrinomonadaceae bacterium]|nr:hypothetical protein [Pyrinomonadaceae bacterium]
MLSSNPIKFFFALVFALSFSSSCLWRRAESEKPPPQTLQTFTAAELKSEIPFSTKEPENFQAEFVVIADNRKTKTFFARDGDKRRFDYAFGTTKRFTILETGANQNFLIFPAKKIYAENSASEIPARTTADWNDFLTDQWLNARAEAKFTNLGTENNLTKYLVASNDGEVAETIVFVDENIGLPVKQEFYSIEGEQKILTFTFEMRNFNTKIDSDLFEIPKDFRKVSSGSLRTAMQKESFVEE